MTQPLSALSRPIDPADVRVPVVQMGALDELDVLAELSAGRAADVEPGDSRNG